MNKQETINAAEEVLDRFDSEDFEVRVYFQWGRDVESILSGKSPWQTGYLYCHWLASSEEFFKVRTKMNGVRLALQALEPVRVIRLETYNRESGMSDGGLRGEKWEIAFH